MILLKPPKPACCRHRWRDKATGKWRSAMWAWLLPWTVTPLQPNDDEEQPGQREG